MITLRLNKRNSTDADDAEAIQTLLDNNEDLSIFTYYIWGDLMGLMFYEGEDKIDVAKDIINMHRRVFSDGGAGIKLHGKLADDPEWLDV